jgi:hypothetical protein
MHPRSKTLTRFLRNSRCRFLSSSISTALQILRFANNSLPIQTVSTASDSIRLQMRDASAIRLLASENGLQSNP